MRYPHHWIAEEMSQPSNPHPYWWREIKTSRKLNLGAHIVQEGYNNFSAQHYTLRQVAAFSLPVAQQEVSGWWNTPPVLHGLCLQDFLPSASSPRISGSSDRRRH